VAIIDDQLPKLGRVARALRRRVAIFLTVVHRVSPADAAKERRLQVDARILFGQLDMIHAECLSSDKLSRGRLIWS
jgi:hypothetical protein